MRLDWQVLFVVGFFAVLAVAGVAAAWQKDAPLVQVQVNVPKDALEGVSAQAQALLADVQTRSVQALDDAHQLLAALRQKVEGSEQVFASLEEAARLLQGEAQAVSEFSHTARVLLWVAVGLLIIAVLLLSAQLFVVRSLWAVTVAYTEVDLRQQQGLWHGFKELLKRLRNGHRPAADDGEPRSPKGDGGRQA